jgi:hypothetical protein
MTRDPFWQSWIVDQFYTGGAFSLHFIELSLNVGYSTYADRLGYRDLAAFSMQQ